MCGFRFEVCAFWTASVSALCVTGINPVSWCAFLIARVRAAEMLGLRTLLRLLSGTNETILDVCCGEEC